MPNRILLVFNGEHEYVRGMPIDCDQGESDLEIATEVCRKAFWGTHSPSQGGGPADTNVWNPQLTNMEGHNPDSVALALGHQLAGYDPALETAESDQIRHQLKDETKQAATRCLQPVHGLVRVVPCFAVFDRTLWTKCDDTSKELFSTAVEWLNAQKVPVYLVSTAALPNISMEVRKLLRPDDADLVHIARSDSNIWDSLYNTIKRGEHKVRLREVERGQPQSVSCGPGGVVNLKKHRHFSTPIVVDGKNAANFLIRARDCRISVPVVIRNCRIESLDFRRVTFEKDVLLDQVEIEHDLKVRDCAFGSVLHLNECICRGDVLIQTSGFQKRMPWFHKCWFHWRFEFLHNAAPDPIKMEGAPTLFFSRCVFAATNHIKMPSKAVDSGKNGIKGKGAYTEQSEFSAGARLTFFSCDFELGEYTEVGWPEKYPSYRRAPTDNESDSEDGSKTKKVAWDYDPYIRFISCAIGARVVLRTERDMLDVKESTNDTESEYKETKIMVSLEGSTVTGVIDLQDVSVRSIDAYRTTFPSGGIAMPSIQSVPFTFARVPSFSTVWIAFVAVFLAIASFVASLVVGCIGVTSLVIASATGMLVYTIGCSCWWKWVDCHRPELPKEEKRSRGVAGFLAALICLAKLNLIGTRRLLWGDGFLTGLVFDELVNEHSRLASFWNDKEHSASKGITRFLCNLRNSFLKWCIADRVPSDLLAKWRFADIMRFRKELGVVSCKNVGDNARTDDYSTYLKVLYAAIAQQYEDLKYAFSHASVVDDLEDFCHFKAMKYRNEHFGVSIPLWQRIGVRVMVSSGICLAVLLVLKVCSSGALGPGLDPKHPMAYTPPILGHAWWIGTGLMFLFFAVGCVLVWGDWSGSGRRLASYVMVARAWQHFFQRNLSEARLCYFVYLRAVIILAVQIVLLYSIVYFTAISCDRDGSFGTIENLGRLSESPSLVERLDCFTRSTYFSAVTFTTLGYGDYAPTGFLRVVAASEAFLGALTLAAITVALVRQFLRR